MVDAAKAGPVEEVQTAIDNSAAVMHRAIEVQNERRAPVLTPSYFTDVCSNEIHSVRRVSCLLDKGVTNQ